MHEFPLQEVLLVLEVLLAPTFEFLAEGFLHVAHLHVLLQLEFVFEFAHFFRQFFSISQFLVRNDFFDQYFFILVEQCHTFCKIGFDMRERFENG